jgi:hypothetical protein
MPSSGMLRCMVVVRTDVSEEHIASIIRVTRIGELGTLAVTSNRRTLRRILVRNVGSYKSHTRNIPEDGILHSARVFVYLVRLHRFVEESLPWLTWSWSLLGHCLCVLFPLADTPVLIRFRHQISRAQVVLQASLKNPLDRRVPEVAAVKEHSCRRH